MIRCRLDRLWSVDNARERGELSCELPETLMHMPGDLGRAAIIRDMRPLSESDIVAVVDELFLPLVRYYEQRSRTRATAVSHGPECE
ncbi:hypothetical protein [Bifidobacterium catulorum]|uniref:Uncharacterized protein n=1 Tax=Bifidobacterium catulorum TaxID=1630173 RepID=A0A2U2MUT8_9BIFI|nr:hypothetical protein [Bifidobacterium catulorum]PWG60638.1 hypothetical protein DF200_01845 [Bifidobacterium catulorum]